MIFFEQKVSISVSQLEEKKSFLALLILESTFSDSINGFRFQRHYIIHGAGVNRRDFHIQKLWKWFSCDSEKIILTQKCFHKDLIPIKHL